MNKIHSSSVGFQKGKTILRKESTLGVPGLLLLQLRPVGPQSVNNLSIEVTVEHRVVQSIHNFWWNLSQLFNLYWISFLPRVRSSCNHRLYYFPTWAKKAGVTSAMTLPPAVSKRFVRLWHPHWNPNVSCIHPSGCWCSPQALTTFSSNSGKNKR